MELNYIYDKIAELPLEELERMRDHLIPADRQYDIFPDTTKKMREATGMSVEEFKDLKNQALDMAEILINLRISELKNKKNE